MLEVLVHLEVDSIPPPFQLMRIQVPDGLPHSAWPNSARSDLSSETAEWGDAWLARGDTALARVPSAIAPDSFNRSEEHTSELQSLMRISYAVFCLKKKKQNTTKTQINDNMYIIKN